MSSQVLSVTQMPTGPTKADDLSAEIRALPLRVTYESDSIATKGEYHLSTVQLCGFGGMATYRRRYGSKHSKLVHYFGNEVTTPWCFESDKEYDYTTARFVNHASLHGGSASLGSKFIIDAILKTIMETGYYRVAYW